MPKQLKQQALELRGIRVRAEFSDCSVVSTLRFVTPSGHLVFAGPNGHDYKLPLDDLKAIRDSRWRCENCGGLSNLAYQGREDPRWFCPDCSRKRAYELPPPVMECPECHGENPAVFSPKTKKYACFKCHGIGGLTGLGPEVRVLIAVCRGADTDDPRHEWKQVRNSRWRCRTCHADRYVKPVGWDDKYNELW